MKKINLVLCSLAIFVASCHSPKVESPSDDGNVYLQIGSKILQVHAVTINSSGKVIYVLTPKDTTVQVSIETIGFTDGKQPSSIIKVE